MLITAKLALPMSGCLPEEEISGADPGSGRNSAKLSRIILHAGSKVYDKPYT